MSNDPFPPEALRPGEPPGAGGPPLTPGTSPAIQPAPREGTLPAKTPSTRESKEGWRDIVETVVFVVVLVLLLKTFLAEAFVIPTGSMATTLLGYHKEVTCEKCHYPFRVNASEEVERSPPDRVIQWTCPNCRYRHHEKF